MQSQSLKPEGVAEIRENILLEFSFIFLEGRDNACHKKSNPRQLISDLALLSGENWLNLEVIKFSFQLSTKLDLNVRLFLLLHYENILGFTIT